MARAPRTRKVPVALPEMESAPEHWLRHIRVSGFAVTVLGLIVLGLIVLAPNLRELVDQQRQIAELQQQKKDAQAQVDQLTEQLARWSDPAYIEAQARDRLYYVKPGEYPYLIVGAKDASSDTPTTVSDTITTTQTDWLGGLLSSVVTAGTTDKTPAELSQ